MAETTRINPIRLTIDGETYELDFNKDSVRFAENREFVLDNVMKFPATTVPEFFWYAFRWHHKSVSLAKAGEILSAMGGLSPKVLNRLVELYQQAQYSNNLQTDEDLEKNGAVTVEL